MPAVRFAVFKLKLGKYGNISEGCQKLMIKSRIKRKNRLTILRRRLVNGPEHEQNGKSMVCESLRRFFLFAKGGRGGGASAVKILFPTLLTGGSNLF